MPFGNVNVDYAPCKAVGQLKSAELYMLGQKKEQLQNGVVKTSKELYSAFGCNRDKFSQSLLITRKLWNKPVKKNAILAHKMSISFHPDDRLSYQTAFEIAKEFAEKFFGSKGFEVLFAVHTDKEHIHAHFLIGNCNTETGKSFRRGQKELYEMSEFFGEQCLRYGLKNSVRDEFYSDNLSREKLTFAEQQMRKRGAESFKDELREAIRIEINDPNNHSFDDVVKALSEHYNVECRVAGNTISYRHPEHKDKNGKPVSVRGNRLGDLFTKRGIENELTKKQSITAQRRELTAVYGLDHTAAGASELVAESNNASGKRQVVGRGQVPSHIATGNGGEDVRSIDEFYDRYRKRAEVDEHTADEAVKRARTIQKRNKNKGR